MVVLQVLGIFFGTVTSKFIHQRRTGQPNESVGPDQYQTRILELLEGNGRVTRKDVISLLGVSKRTANRLLADLESAGRLRRQGDNRNTHYVSMEKT